MVTKQQFRCPFLWNYSFRLHICHRIYYTATSGTMIATYIQQTSSFRGSDHNIFSCHRQPVRWTCSRWRFSLWGIQMLSGYSCSFAGATFIFRVRFCICMWVTWKFEISSYIKLAIEWLWRKVFIRNAFLGGNDACLHFRRIDLEWYIFFWWHLLLRFHFFSWIMVSKPFNSDTAEFKLPFASNFKLAAFSGSLEKKANLELFAA